MKFKFIILFLIFGVSVVSAEITLKASVDKNTVGLNQTVNYKVVVSGDQNTPSPTLPVLSDFTIQGRGSSTSVTIVNGSMSTSKVFNYVLIPKKEGEFTIPPSVLKYKGQIYKTASFKIKVVPAAQAPQQQRQQRQQQSQDPFDQIFNPPTQQTPFRAFAKVAVRRSYVYVGQQVPVVAKLFFSGNVGLRSVRAVWPTLDGFLSENVQTKDHRIRPEKPQVVDGVKYMVYPVEKKILFPLSSGRKTIADTKIEMGIASFFGSVSKLATSKPVTIHVLPLPEPQPQQFSGSVGQFSISATTKSTRYKQNEGVGLNVVIEGVGNIKAIEKPILPDLSNFKIYKSTSTSQIDTMSGYMKGKKTFEFILTPLKSGHLVIPPFKYIYFDPNKKQYVTIRSKPISLSIQSVSKQEMQNIVYPIQDDVRLMNQDIAYIKMPKTLKSYKSFYKSGVALLIFILESFIFLLGLGYYFYKRRMESDIEYARKSRAYVRYKKHYNKLLKKNEKSNGDFSYIIGEMEPLVLNYVADKLNIPGSHLILDNIISVLKKAGIKEEILDDLSSLVEDIQMLKYSSMKDHQAETIKNLMQRINSTVSRIESSKGVKI